MLGTVELLLTRGLARGLAGGRLQYLCGSFVFDRGDLVGRDGGFKGATNDEGVVGSDSEEVRFVVLETLYVCGFSVRVC
jgi:hypothetical protein